MYGKCYRFNAGKNLSGFTTKFKTSTTSGQNFGLKMDLLIQNEENYDFRRFNVYVHSYTEEPKSISNKGILVSTGHYHHFVIKRMTSFPLLKLQKN